MNAEEKRIADHADAVAAKVAAAQQKRLRQAKKRETAANELASAVDAEMVLDYRIATGLWHD